MIIDLALSVCLLAITTAIQYRRRLAQSQAQLQDAHRCVGHLEGELVRTSNSLKKSLEREEQLKKKDCRDITTQTDAINSCCALTKDDISIKKPALGECDDSYTNPLTVKVHITHAATEANTSRATGERHEPVTNGEFDIRVKDNQQDSNDKTEREAGTGPSPVPTVSKHAEDVLENQPHLVQSSKAVSENQLEAVPAGDGCPVQDSNDNGSISLDEAARDIVHQEGPGENCTTTIPGCSGNTEAEKHNGNITEDSNLYSHADKMPFSKISGAGKGSMLSSGRVKAPDIVPRTSANTTNPQAILPNPQNRETKKPCKEINIRDEEFLDLLLRGESLMDHSSPNAHSENSVSDESVSLQDRDNAGGAQLSQETAKTKRPGITVVEGHAKLPTSELESFTYYCTMDNYSLVIGPKGRNLQFLQQAFGVHIVVTQEDPRYKCVNVTGTKAQLTEAMNYLDNGVLGRIVESNLAKVLRSNCDNYY